MATRRWAWIWAGALVIAALAATGWEIAIRKYGETPIVLDDEDLWAVQLDRALAHPEGIVMLGASRIVYGIDTGIVEQLTGTPTMMLAVPGRYPLATLRELADETEFRGLVVVGIDSRGLLAQYRDMQQRYLSHYRLRWSWARRAHRVLLSFLQPHLLLLRPEYSLVNLVKRRAAGLPPPREEYHVTRASNRSARIHFDGMDVGRIRPRNVANLAQLYDKLHKPEPARFVSDLADMARWVDTIEQRGGRVVFFREPVAGEHLALDEANLPREDYWNAVREAYGLAMIDFRDSARFAGFTLPDNSHVSADQVPRLTHALVDELRDRDLVARSGPVLRARTQPQPKR